MAKAPAGTRLTFRECLHSAALCEPGDVLETATGRRYEVLAVDGKAIRVRVMRIAEQIPAGARLLYWRWATRKKAWKPGDNPLPFTEGTAKTETEGGNSEVSPKTV